MTRIAKTPEQVATYNETMKTSEFVKRIAQAKVDPAIIGYSDQVSGLFQNGKWMFVCSQHVFARFANEEELKGHFRNEPHTKSKFGRSQSTYD